MYKSILFTLTIISAILVIPPAGHAEYIFKKDGSIIQGSIIRDGAKAVTFRRSDNRKLITVPQSDIMRIQYTQLYMGKVFIRFTSGKVIEGYMVDEDQETYTFRKDLYKPEEFKIKRTKVMFLTRSNPTDLAAKAGTTWIELKWNPPFVKPESYIVYLKSSSEKKFRVAGKLEDTSFKVTGLKSNTKYSIYVTAIDKEKKESLPSDEVKSATVNIKPTVPDLSISQSFEKNGKLKAVLSWNPSTDADGSVKGYNIYKKKDGRFVKISQTRNTSHSIPGLDYKDTHIFLVRAVDDLGTESEKSITVSTLKKRWGLSMEAVYFMPKGNFADIADSGMGGLVKAEISNLLTRNLHIGIESGYVQSGGFEEEVEYFRMIPVTACCGYSLHPSRLLTITPALSAGYAYLEVSYMKGGGSVYKTESAWEPIASAGLDIDFNFNRNFSITLGGRYGALFEKDGEMYFTSFRAGLTCRLDM